MHQIFFEAMTIENIAAPAFQIDAARLAGFPFVRWKPLAGIPQRIFPRGPIPLMTPRLSVRTVFDPVTEALLNCKNRPALSPKLREIKWDFHVALLQARKEGTLVGRDAWQLELRP
jgi:hypothetical protein